MSDTASIDTTADPAANDTERPTNLVDLFAELTPPPEPPAISLVPNTWGWPILLCLIGVAALVLFRKWQARHAAEAYRRAALSALDAAVPDPTQVAQVLRQTALTAYPRTDVAGLTGEDWLAFLNKTCPGDPFHGDAADALVTAPYAGTARLPDASVDLVRAWIRSHVRASPS